jgi:hypothetical protein
MLIEADVLANVGRQCRDGEIAVPVDRRGPVRISADGMTAEPLPPSPALAALRLRSARAMRLAQSDWTQLPDSPLTAAQKAEWRKYRKALRDLPDDQPGATIETVEWPEPPATA